MKTTPSSRRRGRVLLCFGTAIVLAAATPAPALANPPGVPESGSPPDSGASPGDEPDSDAGDLLPDSDLPTSGPGISRGPYANKIAERTSEVAKLGEETNAAEAELTWRKDITTSAVGELEKLRQEADATAALANEMAVNAYQQKASEVPGITEEFQELFVANPALLEYDTRAIASEAESAQQAAAAAQATLDAAVAAEDIADSQHKQLDEQLKEDTAELEDLIAKNLRAIEEQEDQAAAENHANGKDIGSDTGDAKAGEDAEEAVEFALRQEGKPYEWGSQGPDTYDCSGLMLDAYGELGVELPRVSFDQFRSTSTEAVAVEQMLPGDLIFYGEVPGDWTSVYHVAMYIGDGEMVHAPRPGDVVRVAPVSFDEFVGAHRVVDADVEVDTESEKDQDPRPPGPPPDKPAPESRPIDPEPSDEPGGGGSQPAPQPTPTPAPG